MEKFQLEFQEYEIKHILAALEKARDEEKARNGKWEKQKDGVNWFHSETKKSKQLKFSINSIKKQLAQQKEVNDFTLFSK